MCNENDELKRRIDELARMLESKNREVHGLSQRSVEADELNRQVGGLNTQIKRLTGEN